MKQVYYICFSLYDVDSLLPYHIKSRFKSMFEIILQTNGSSSHFVSYLPFDQGGRGPGVSWGSKDT
jgi:hypothetical protein